MRNQQPTGHKAPGRVKISILVAVYNTEKYLRECLNSLINQSLKDIQIICINDGSTDGSQAILEEYALKDKRILLLSQKNSGASSARNLGIQYVEGDYVCMVDSDDYIDKDCLKNSYYQARKENLDATIFQLCYFGSNSKFKHNYSDKILSGKEATLLSLFWSISGIGLFRSSIIKEIKYCTETMNGDELSVRKFFLTCDKVGFSDGKYFYRQHPDSTTKKFSIKLFDVLETNIMIRDFLIDKKIYDEIKNRFEIEVFGSFLASSILFINSQKKLTCEEVELLNKKFEKAYNSFDFSYLRNIPIHEKILKKIVLIVSRKSKNYNQLRKIVSPIATLLRLQEKLRSI